MSNIRTVVAAPSTRTRARKRVAPSGIPPSPRGDKPLAPGDDPTTRASLTPQDWANAATTMLIDQGIDAVRVDAVARALGVTRGSFYWHFKDRADLLRYVLQSWRERTTENLTRRLENASHDPREQLRDVLTLPFRGESAKRAARIELAIRAWARRDAMARQYVDESDASRVGYIAQIFSSLGFAAGEARHRAVMAYSMNVACSQLTVAGGVWQPKELAAFAEGLLVQQV